ncbi:MAG: ATP-binding protein [Ignavibacteria bacterium]|jgi:hypothetical protein
MNGNKILDDWREETQARIKNSLLYIILQKKCDNDPYGKHVTALVDDAIYYAYHRTKLVLRFMGEYTLHDGEHLFRVLKIMEILLGEESISKLSIPEIMLLILTAFFHDIGMAPAEKEVRSWKKIWEAKQPTHEELEEYEKFNRFFEAKPERVNEYKKYIQNEEYSKSELILDGLISEYIRITHSDRSRNIIDNDWNGKIKYKDVDLTYEFAQLCFSHNTDAFTLLELDQSLNCGNKVFICLPFIGVILRLADILDFDSKRTPQVLFSHLTVRNPVSLAEWKKHISVESWDISQRHIGYSAKCEHPAIESTINKFCDQIDKELISCNNILTNLHDDAREEFNSIYKISFPPKVDRSKIKAKKTIFGKPIYKYHDTFFNLNKQQVIDLLMGTKLYGDPSVALRELLQNSIDACLLRQAMEKAWGNNYEPKIKVELVKEKGIEYLIVDDNGIGMDTEIIEKYYSQIGSSFYKSSDFYDIRAKYNLGFTPTSRFGIGILSCFMVSDTLEVDTRRLLGPHTSSESNKVIVEGLESIFWIKEGNKVQPGTTTKLFLRKKHPWDSMTDDQLIQYVEKTIPNPPFKIDISTPNKNESHTNTKFIEQTTDSLKNFSWREDENINEIEFKFDCSQSGLTGVCRVGILEKKDEPVSKIEILSKEVMVEGEEFELNLEKYIEENSIKKRSDSIEVNDDNEIEVNTSYTTIQESKSKVSMYGIEIPTTLFPASWERQNSPKLDLPFPALIIVDIGGSIDLDLNSSRTKIISNEKWMKFEEILCKIICDGIKNNVNDAYWESLKTIFLDKSSNKIFIEVLENM